jgi:hypothetical protein
VLKVGVATRSAAAKIKTGSDRKNAVPWRSGIGWMRSAAMKR